MQREETSKITRCWLQVAKLTLDTAKDSTLGAMETTVERGQGSPGLRGQEGYRVKKAVRQLGEGQG